MAPVKLPDPHDHASQRRRQSVPMFSPCDPDDLAQLLNGARRDFEVELAASVADVPTAPLDELRIYQRCEYGRHLVAVVAILRGEFLRTSLRLELSERALHL
jgi:hypothetical protein